jgi:predicted CXXCH cytochrome family protein
MSKNYLILVLSFVMILSQAAMSQHIAGSKHDFSNQTWNPTNPKEICVVCHTPHNANITITNSALWNHAVTVSTFVPYTSATFKGVAGQPDESSKLCLSCHDGTVALENFGTTTNGTHFIGSLSGGISNLGTDMRDDHPISFTYDAALSTADKYVYNPTVQTTGLGGTITQDLLINNKMQCYSCHDVHNSSGVNHLLRMSNAGSALCLVCHNR